MNYFGRKQHNKFVHETTMSNETQNKIIKIRIVIFICKQSDRIHTETTFQFLIWSPYRLNHIIGNRIIPAIDNNTI